MLLFFPDFFVTIVFFGLVGVYVIYGQDRLDFSGGQPRQ